MSTVETVTALILEVIDEFNELRDNKPKISKAPDALLFGPDAPVDSLDLARLILTVEDLVAERLQVPISLVDEKAMSQRNSPFRSVDRLASYIVSLLNETSYA